MKKKFIDPLIKRKANLTKQIQFTKNDVPLPSVVEISESGMCNRKCSFCPRSDPNYNHVNEFISDKLIIKLSKELFEYNYKGIFLFSGFVEPMLDKNIYNLIRIVSKNLPECRIEMVSNGDALNKNRVIKLFNSGLTTLLVSIYDGKKEAEAMERLLKSAGLEPEDYKVRHRYLPKEKDFGITLSNRAGTMDNAEFSIPSLKEPLKKPCNYPHYTFFMDYNGDVLICSHDWGKKIIAGNIKKDKFIDIWCGEKFSSARQRLAKSDRNFSPCDKCDVTGTFMGANHASSWKKIYN